MKTTYQMIGPRERQLWTKNFESGNQCHGVVILGTGSGEIRSVDDDSIEDICVWLGDLGWSSVVYDKYGCGESEGDWKSVTFDDLRDDLVILADHFKQQNFGKIVVLGQSESSILAAEAATRTSNIDALVLRVASHQDISERIKMQLGIEKWTKWLADLENSKVNGKMFVASHPVSYWLSRMNRILTGDVVAGLNIPIIALNGAEDHFTPPTAFSKIHEAILQQKNTLNKAIVIPGVGHGLMLQSEKWNSSVVAKEIQLFLTAVAEQ
ncbi:alpha/beta hydrolase [Bdellovibrio sp. HCB288]|uniref:alpha/beta hydrolase n=1 Tax=Bdellovibrio sp. HCB288 TaxID=3394355 RepID=UPI0039B37524